jgi:hypothetical protein
MARNREAAPTSSGFGESRMFGGTHTPEGVGGNPNIVTLIDGSVLALEDCHLDGRRVGDLNFGPEQLSAIRGLVDEVMGGRNAELPEARVTVGRESEYDRHFREQSHARDVRREFRRGDDGAEAMAMYEDLFNGKSPDDQVDPRKKALDYLPVGFEARWCSKDPRFAKPEDRGYVPVTEAGKPVEMMNSVLGIRPKDVGARRRTKQREGFRNIDARIENEYEAHRKMVGDLGLPPAMAGAGLTRDVPFSNEEAN